MANTACNERIASRLRPHLLPGEELKWIDRPVQGFWRWPKLSIAAALVVASGFTLAFLGLTTLIALAPAVQLGLWMMVGGVATIFGAIAQDAWMRSVTYYAVSQSRAFVGQTLPLNTPRSITIPNGVKCDHQNDLCNLIISHHYNRTYSGDERHPMLTLRALEKPGEVYELVRGPESRLHVYDDEDLEFVDEDEDPSDE